MKTTKTLKQRLKEVTSAVKNNGFGSDLILLNDETTGNKVELRRWAPSANPKDDVYSAKVESRPTTISEL